MFLSSITIEQVRSLENVFAKFTEQGWVLPQWLIDLKRAVSKRDLARIGVIV